MKILSSQVQLSGRQLNSETSMRLERLSASAIEQDTTSGSSGSNNDTASINLSISNTASEQQRIQTESTIVALDTGSISQQYAGLQIADYLVEQSSEMSLSVAEVSQVLVANPGMTVNNVEIGAREEVVVEVLSLLTQDSSESLTFEALGQVTTEDGSQIDFMLALDFDRSTHTEQLNQFQGNRNLIDPLMINLNGGAVGFSDLTFEFDLDSDGEMETIAQAASGSGFIVFDKNQNGIIDNGSEMFGPQSGQGFAELSQYDEDGNGWIDENDSIYSQLGVMTFSGQSQVDGQGEGQGAVQETQSLMAAQVGALFLGSVTADYELNTESGLFAGTIKQSGAALAEDGRVLLMQEVHMADYSAASESRDGPLNVITDFETDSPFPMRPESPLNLFQFNDPIIELRDAQTTVVIRAEEELVIGASFTLQLSTAVENNGSEQDTLAKQTFDRGKVALELSEWVASAMEDFEPSSVNSKAVAETKLFFEVDQAKPPVFGQALTELDLDSMKLESRLGVMRSMIDSLRDMRQQVADSTTKMSLYHRIERFD